MQSGLSAGRSGSHGLRGVCAHTGALVVPGAVSIAGVQGLFDEDGSCNDEPTKQVLAGLASSLTGFLREYVCPKYALESMVRGGGPGWSAAV